MLIKAPRLHMVREITYLLTSFQAAEEHARKAHEESTDVRKQFGTNQQRIKEIAPSERLNLARICSRGRQQNTSPTSGNNSLAG
jgi:hypothetical protein